MNVIDRRFKLEDTVHKILKRAPKTFGNSKLGIHVAPFLNLPTDFEPAPRTTQHYFLSSSLSSFFLSPFPSFLPLFSPVTAPIALFTASDCGSTPGRFSNTF